MSAAALKKLTPEEELKTLRQEFGVTEPLRILDRALGQLNVLQTRSGMMISLIALCLTISGFSGHRIAASGRVPAVLMSGGLMFAVLSGVILFFGPLQVRWVTAYAHPDGVEARLLALIKLRNDRTRLFNVAAGCTVFALICYVGAVVISLMPGEGL
jgi:hypothetical protein